VVVQTANNQSSDQPSLQRQLIDRQHFILAVIATMAFLFVLDELLTAEHPLGPFLAFRAAWVAMSWILGYLRSVAMPHGKTLLPSALAVCS